MKRFHVICGLPRSGSTLLCNVLNQNPEFRASATSPLPQILSTLSNAVSNDPDFKSWLIHDQEGTTERMNRVFRGIIEAWYADEDRVVFDKSRGWAYNALLLKKLYPESRIIVMVRDLRSVFASIEKRHRAEPALDLAGNAMEKTVYERADMMFGPDGIIGSSIAGIEDLLRRKPPGVVVVQYESFAENPEIIMGMLYQQLGLPFYEHDFDDVESVAEEVDGLYLNKFPHEGGGRIEPPARDGWRDYVSDDIAQLVMGKFAYFNQTFGYS